MTPPTYKQLFYKKYELEKQWSKEWHKNNVTKADIIALDIAELERHMLKIRTPCGVRVSDFRPPEPPPKWYRLERFTVMTKRPFRELRHHCSGHGIIFRLEQTPALPFGLVACYYPTSRGKRPNTLAERALAWVQDMQFKWGLEGDLDSTPHRT